MPATSLDVKWWRPHVRQVSKSQRVNCSSCDESRACITAKTVWGECLECFDGRRHKRYEWLRCVEQRVPLNDTRDDQHRRSDGHVPDAAAIGLLIIELVSLNSVTVS